MKNFSQSQSKYLKLILFSSVLYWFPGFLMFPFLRDVPIIPVISLFFESISYWLYPTWAVVATVLLIFINSRLGLFENWKETFRLRNLSLLMGLVILALVLNYSITLYLSEYFPEVFLNSNQAKVESFLALLPGWFQFFGPVIQGPVFEESIFRAYAFPLFKNKKLGFTLIVLLFAYLHSGFTPPFIMYLASSF